MFGSASAKPKHRSHSQDRTIYVRRKSPASQKAFDVSPDIQCVFEPIYRRMGHRFIPTGHKAHAIVHHEGGFPDSQHLNLGASLLRASKNGLKQVDLIASAMDAFRRQYQPEDRLAFEIDYHDLMAAPDQLETLGSLFSQIEKVGIPANQFYVDLSMHSSGDLGKLYAMVDELRGFGARVSLINCDPDSTSFTRIMKVQPFMVKFPRSWFVLCRENKNWQNMFSSIVTSLHAMGTYAGIMDVETDSDLMLAHNIGLTRCQGRYFGQPSATLSRGQIYTV